MASYGFPDDNEGKKVAATATAGAKNTFKKGPVVKLLVVGDSGAGKSSLLLRFCDDQYMPNYISTIGLDFKMKPVEIEGQTIRLQIWDAAGQERFRSIVAAYYRGAQGIALVYDLSDPESFRSVRNWMKQIESNTKNSVDLILVGNKSDLERKVTTDEGKKLADEVGAPYFETSAKTGEGVNEAIRQLATMALATLRKSTEDTKHGASCQLNTQSNTDRNTCANNSCERF